MNWPHSGTGRSLDSITSAAYSTLGPSEYRCCLELSHTTSKISTEPFLHYVVVVGSKGLEKWHVQWLVSVYCVSRRHISVTPCSRAIYRASEFLVWAEWPSNRSRTFISPWRFYWINEINHANQEHFFSNMSPFGVKYRDSFRRYTVFDFVLSPCAFEYEHRWNVSAGRIFTAHRSCQMFFHH
jgi:hypothetical protein